VGVSFTKIPVRAEFTRSGHERTSTDGNAVSTSTGRPTNPSARPRNPVVAFVHAGNARLRRRAHAHALCLAGEQLAENAVQCFPVSAAVDSEPDPVSELRRCADLQTFWPLLQEYPYYRDVEHNRCGIYLVPVRIRVCAHQLSRA